MAALDIFRIGENQELTDELLLKYISQNDTKSNSQYLPLWKAYNNDYDIFHQKNKPEYKPDNRLAVNFAQYIVDTFEGFFLGIPLRVSSENEMVNEYVNAVNESNDVDNLNMELSTIVSIFGRGYRIVYVDENGNIGSAYLDPMESFAIYDEAITPKMQYFVRTYIDNEKVRRGSISDSNTVRYFRVDTSEITWEEEQPHGFDGVPCVEFIQNRNRTGIFQSVMSLINEFNKALSEKANDVDYFADAYLKVLGAKIDQETIKFMRENRTINISGMAGADVVVDFLQKPSSDTTQENLLNRVENLIFTIAMVCNISDDNFATSSGIALKYKMLPMINLASKKWMKFEKSLNDVNKLICSNPVTPLYPDDWQDIDYMHVLNYPANVMEETQIASNLSGITSRKTQLSVLSIVDNVDDEMKQISEEQEEDLEYVTDYETKRVSDKETKELGGVSNEAVKGRKVFEKPV